MRSAALFIPVYQAIRRRTTMLAHTSYPFLESSQQPKMNVTAGIAWRCNECQVWWGSQIHTWPNTSFLNRLPEDVAAGLSWEEYRGWRDKGDNMICPQCSQPTGHQIYTAD
jgi:hypothetical protein